MKLVIKACATCGVLGVGPQKVPLFTLNGRYYCERGTPKKPGCYRTALNWEEARGKVVQGIEHAVKLVDGTLEEDAKRVQKLRRETLQGIKRIRFWSDLASVALAEGRKQQFVAAFVRAMVAWEEIYGTDERA